MIKVLAFGSPKQDKSGRFEESSPAPAGGQICPISNFAPRYTNEILSKRGISRVA
jgi:hypothetical protein